MFTPLPQSLFNENILEVLYDLKSLSMYNHQLGHDRMDGGDGAHLRGLLLTITIFPTARLTLLRG